MKRLLACIAVLSLFTVPSFAADCVEVDLDVDPILIPGEMFYFFAELTNCGDEGGVIFLTIEVSHDAGTFTIPEIPVYMAAGETFTCSVPMVLPHAIPTGDGSICVTAVKGDAEASDCIYFTIENDAGSGQKQNIESKELESSGAMD